MTTTPTQDTIMDLIAAELPTDRAKLNTDTRFIEDLRADSLDVVELSIHIEDAFGIEIADETMLKMKTLGELVAEVTRLSQAKAL